MDDNYDLEDFAREERLAVEVEIDREKGYLMMLGVSFDWGRADEVMDFYRQFGGSLKKEGITTYGNSDSARQEVMEDDIMGVYRDGEWAVDTFNILGKIRDVGNTMLPGRTADYISAATLEAVSLAQESRPHPEGYSFYWKIIQELKIDEDPVETSFSGKEPVEIEVEEEYEINYEEIVAGSIPEIREDLVRLEEEGKLDSGDIEAILEADRERPGGERVTLESRLRRELPGEYFQEEDS